MSKRQLPDLKPRRRYLPAVARKRELLDAALIEFSTHGFGAATIERIAARAGLSKAGVYAHYTGKDAIFEDLLQQLLTPSFPIHTWQLDNGLPLHDAIDQFLAQFYAPLEDPKFLAMLRIVIVDGGRARHLVERWHREIIRPYIDAQQRLIDDSVAKGRMRDSAMTRFFQLAIAPVVMAAHLRLLFNASEADDGVAQVRRMHRELLREVLGAG